MRKSLLALATLLHLLPHPFGASPVGALALYGGAYGKRRTAMAVPLLPLLAAGVISGFYDLRVMLFVFAGFALAALVGHGLLRRQRNYRRYGAAVVGGATVFFLLSNFSIWLVGMYPPTMAGLVACYVNGLPYLGQAILADAAYSFLLFGLHAALDRHQSVPAAA